MKTQAKAKLRYLRMAPRKVRLLIDLVKGMKVEEAIVELRHSEKHAARPVLKLLQSATANAVHNHEMKEESLMIKEAYVDGGPVLRRWKPRAFGRATPIRKRSSHVTIVLEGDVDEKKQVKKEKVRETENITDKKEIKDTKKDTKDIEEKKKAAKAPKAVKTVTKKKDKKSKEVVKKGKIN